MMVSSMTDKPPRHLSPSRSSATALHTYGVKTHYELQVEERTAEHRVRDSCLWRTLFEVLLCIMNEKLVTEVVGQFFNFYTQNLVVDKC